MKHNGNLDVKGMVLASSASINSLNAIQAISISNDGSATSGTVRFVNSNNVIFGISQTGSSNTLTANAAQWPLASNWQNVQGVQDLSLANMNQGTTSAVAGVTQETALMYISPVIVPCNVYFTNVVGLLNLATTVNTTGSATERMHWGVYKQDVSTMRLESSWVFNMQMSQNSSTAHQYSYWFFDNTTSSKATTNPANVLDLSFRVTIGSGTGDFLTEGQHWFAQAYQKTSAGFASLNMISRMCMLSANNSNDPRWDIGQSSQSPLHPLQGALTFSSSGTNSANWYMPATFHITEFTNQTGNTNAGNWRVPLLIFRA